MKIPPQYSPGVSFDDVHSFYDWGLVLQEREIGTPSVKTNTVEVQAVNGNLDLTESLSDEIFFGNREINMTFFTWKSLSERNWAELLSIISNNLHGKRKNIIFDDDSSWYYTGRCAINEFQTSRIKQTISISCDCFPYKYEIFSSLENKDWLWDPFDLDTGIARDYSKLEVSGTLGISVDGSGLPVVPIFYADNIGENGLVVEYLGESYELSSGKNIFYDMKLSGSENILRFVGDGTVSIDYRGGSL